MTGDQQPPRRRAEASAADIGWTALGYLISGMAFWGFVGWLIDHWLRTHGIAIGVGFIVGAALGIYL
ncbi:MAG: synthase protein, partial [Mycobacterium sp.]|nr:synthase protein [Mycobacterium sp.]